jgi:hypothetical protein
MPAVDSERHIRLCLDFAAESIDGIGVQLVSIQLTSPTKKQAAVMQASLC